MKFNWKKLLTVVEKVEQIMDASGLEIAGLSGDELAHITEVALTTGKTVKDAAAEVKKTAKPH